MSDLLKSLCAPFPPSQISWRVGTVFNKSGLESTALVLAYLDARDVMDRLDDVVGPANWQCRYSHTEKKTVCDIGIKIDGEWVWKADGAGDTDVEAEKGALSDAFKRAAVRWGIGRYLYALGDTKAKVTRKSETSKYWVISENEMARLGKLLASRSAETVPQGSAGSPPPPASPAPSPQPDLPKKIDSPEDLERLVSLFLGATSKLQLKALGIKYRSDLAELEGVAPEDVAGARHVYTQRMSELA